MAGFRKTQLLPTLYCTALSIQALFDDFGGRVVSSATTQHVHPILILLIFYSGVV
jgi:hypothetical protein